MYPKLNHKDNVKQKASCKITTVRYYKLFRNQIYVVKT